MSTALSEEAKRAVVVTFAVATALAALLLSGSMEVSELITPGELGPAAEVIAEDFGGESLDPGGTGYDGQQIYAVAREFPDLDAASTQLDTPRYRLLRILPPAVASIAPAGTATVLVLAAINLLGLGLAIWALGSILRAHDIASWWAVPASAPLLVGVATTTVEPIAWGLTLCGIAAALRRQHGPAIAWFAVAALCRETTVVAAGLTAAGLLWHDRRDAWRYLPRYLIVPAVIGAWHLALGRLVSGRLSSKTKVLGFLDYDGNLAVPATVLVLGLVGVWAWRREPLLALPCLGFTAWMAAYTPDTLDPLAIVRVNALPVVLGLAGLGVLATRLRRPGPEASSPGSAQPGPTRTTTPPSSNAIT